MKPHHHTGSARKASAGHERKRAGTQRERALTCLRRLNRLREALLAPARLEGKLKEITDAVVEAFDADSSCVWLAAPQGPGESDRVRTGVGERQRVVGDLGEHLHLMASTGRCPHSAEGGSQQALFACREIGRVAAGQDDRILVENVAQDPRIRSTDWACKLGLASFAAYRLLDESGACMGVLALFAKHEISPEEDALLGGVAHTATQVIRTARGEAQNRYLVRGVESAGEAIFMTDANGVIRYVNPAFTALTGYAPADVIGQDPRILSSGQQSREFYDDMWSTILGGDVWTGELVDRRKDGSLYDVQLTIAPVRDPHGAREGYVAVQRDVSDRKRAEMLLRRANADLTQKNAELDEFSRVASHDLQEPIRKLISFGALLRMDLGGDLPEKAAQDLGFITDAAHRMQRLVQDLLTFSRVGRNAARREHVSLGECADKALAALAAPIAEAEPDLTRDELPEVVGNVTMLTQLYQNLIGNALKFVTPGSRPLIHVTAERVDGEWVFGVRDRGIGIKPEYAEQIFMPFKRLHGRGQYGGTGIGLAICRKAVEWHGGRIWVESQPGEGAHFKFTISGNPEAPEWPSRSSEEPLCC